MVTVAVMVLVLVVVAVVVLVLVVSVGILQKHTTAGTAAPFRESLSLSRTQLLCVVA